MPAFLHGPRAPLILKPWMIDANITQSPKAKRLQALAVECGGACTKVFEQEFFPGFNDGCCAALSLWWLFCHAHDRDFWAFLMEDGAKVRKERSELILDLQMRSDQCTDPVAWEKNWLKKFGLIRQKGSLSHPRTMMDKLSPMTRGMMLGNFIAPTWSRAGYRTIGFYRRGGGHATVAWVGTDVAFFDPGYGEYYFETRSQFRAWYWKYWIETEYHYDEYEIYPYGKDICSTHAARHRNWM